MRAKNFIGNTFLSLAGFGILTLANFVYSIFTVRFLSPEAFSSYNTFFYFLLALPLPSFQLAVAKATGRHHLSLRSQVAFLLPSFLRLAIWSALGYIVLSPLLWFLYGQKYPLFLPLGLLVLEGWIWLSGLRGIYQGMLRFDMFSFNIGIEGISRLIAGTAALLLGLSAYGALGASVISGLVAIGILLIPLLLSQKEEKPSFPEKEVALFRSLIHALLVLLPFGILVVLDQTIINRFLPEYGKTVNLSSLFGKNLIALSLTIAHVVFAYVIKEGENNFFLRGMGIILLLFGIAYLFVRITGRWLFSFLFGSSSGYEFLPLYIGYCLPLGFLQLIVNYSVAKEYHWIISSLWIYGGVISILMILLLRLFSLSLVQWYIFFGSVHMLFVLVLTVLFLFIKKPSQLSP
ncbi:MAG: hypothetical protein ACK4HQ_02980 [Brevinematales bacterium]